MTIDLFSDTPRDIREKAEWAVQFVNSFAHPDLWKTNLVPPHLDTASGFFITELYGAFPFQLTHTSLPPVKIRVPEPWVRAFAEASTIFVTKEDPRRIFVHEIGHVLEGWHYPNTTSRMGGASIRNRNPLDGVRGFVLAAY